MSLKKRSGALRGYGRFVFLAMLCLGEPLELFADTVLLQVCLPEEEDVQLPVDVLNAFEDGIMEPFFDAWHIVCNDRKVGNEEGTVFSGKGIDFYVALDVRYIPPDKAPGILDIRYMLEDSVTRVTLCTGKSSSADFTEAGTGGDTEVYRMQGRAVAMDILLAMPGAM